MSFANIRLLPKHASIFDDRSSYGLREPSVEAPSISSSSEASASLADDNVVDDLVGRPWRSGGWFVVVYGENDVIDFAEGEFSEELHAQLDAGSYTASALAAEIKSKMEAASGVSATYTVSYNASTGKWTISTDQAWLSLLWATGENAATNPNRRNDPTAEDAAALLGFRQHPSSGGGAGGTSTYAGDLEGATSYTGSIVACHSEEWVKFEFELAQPVNCVGLFGHNLSEHAVVTVEANIIDDFGPEAQGAGTIPFSEAVTWRKEGMALFSDALTHSTSQGKYRCFLVRIKDPENTDLYVELGRVIGGCHTELSRNFLWGYSERRVDTSLHFITEGTQRLSKRKKQVRYLDLAFEGTDGDFGSLDAMFRTIGNTDPLMVVLGDADPDAPPLYGYLVGEWAPERAFLNRYNYSLTVEEAA